MIIMVLMNISKIKPINQIENVKYIPLFLGDFHPECGSYGKVNNKI